MSVVVLPQRKSVQEAYIRAREVMQQTLCVADESSPTKRKYLAILRVEGINYTLKGRADQQRIIAQFRTLLRTLSYPLQILLRVTPLNLDTYVNQFLVIEGDSEVKRDMKLAHTKHLRELEAERGGLLERASYVIVPFTFETDPLTNLRFVGRKRRRKQRNITLRQAQQQLTIRCQEVARGLSRMKLQVKRLAADELIRVYHSCVMEERDPLQQGLIDAIDHPTANAWFADEQDTVFLDTLKETVALPDSSEDLSYTFIKTSVFKNKKQSQQANKEIPGITSLPVYTQLADVLSPGGIKLQMNEVCLIDTITEYSRTFIITALSREMVPGWMQPLLEIDEPYVSASMHFTPVPTNQAMTRLQESQNTYQAKKIYAAKKGTMLDIDSEVQGEDGRKLILKVASGEEKMLNVSLYIQVRANSLQDLDDRTQRVLSVVRGMQIQARPAVFLQDGGYRACLPEVSNELAFWGTLFLDSTSAASFWPFFSNSFYMPQGVLIGVTATAKNDPIIIDRWNPLLPNANCLYIGPPGSGKSYAKKCEEERLWLQNTPRQLLILDPEREFKQICDKFSGQWIRLAAGSGHRLNLFDLYALEDATGEEDEAAESSEHGDRLAEKVQSLREIFQIMLARRGPDGVLPLQPEVLGYLERCIYEAYRRVGITSKSNTRGQQPPLLRDVYEIIEKQVFGPDPFDLLSRLYPFVNGSHKSFFDGPTNVRLDSNLVVIDVRDLDTELLPVSLALISEYVWTQSFTSQHLIPREFIIDEAGILAGYEAWARFMSNIVARARKHYLAVSLMLQNLESFNNVYAKTITANCATTVLFGHPQPKPLKDHFDLSEHEEAFLSSCGLGEALILTPSKHIMAKFTANDLEHKLNSTNPVERAQWADQEQAEKTQQKKVEV